MVVLFSEIRSLWEEEGSRSDLQDATIEADQISK